MAGAKDLYEVLGVPRSASGAEIRKVYKRLARKFHPDVNPGDRAAEARFKEISHAADVLGDPEKRKLYDRYGDAAFSAGFDPERAARAEREAKEGFRGAPGGFGGMPFDFDLFGGGGGGRIDLEDLFQGFAGRGQRPRGPVAGEPVQVEVTIPFADAVKGAAVTVPVRTRRPCADCGGSGQSGKSACPGCRGSGERVETERVKVKIPEGVDDGAKVRVAGKGHPSPGGGAAGDLYVVVHVEPHAYFQRQGDDIFTEVPVTVREAYVGAEIEIPTIHGPVRAKIPAGTTGGQKFRLRGRGVRNPQTRAHGDHVYRVNIVVPAVVTEPGKAAAERFEPLYGGPVRAHLPKRLE